MIRPRPARWFEILAAREDATLALSALGATGAVELEAQPIAGVPEEFAEVTPLVAQFAELESRYRAYWPRLREHCSSFPERPAVALTRSLATIRAWAADAEPLIARLQAIDAQRAELGQWLRVLGSIADPSIDFSAFRTGGPVLHKRLFAFPAESETTAPANALTRRVDAPGVRYVLAIGTEEDLAAIAQQCAAAKGRAYETPDWFVGNAAQAAQAIALRLAALEGERAELVQKLAAAHARHDLLTALGDAHRLQWVIEHVRTLDAGNLFCWITGWTSDFSSTTLAKALQESGARALMRFPAPPRGMRPPLLLANPWWARPFEIFSRAIGMPSRNEADPTAVLALTVPLIFGYMFGDVGQGAVLAVGGLLLAPRYPIARLFVAGGISAMVFGVLFGSVFSLQGLIEPRWIDPLETPLLVLMAPLYGGAALLSIGLALSALESFWRGELVRWLATDSAFVVAYLALLTAFFVPDALWVAAIAGLWFCLGHGIVSRSVRAALVAVAELVERLLQLGINSLSFARVGAFALAHAGLSAAIVALMHASGNRIGAAIVLIAGNVIVIVLETLVVSVQTTRLVLFEFFTRFLVAEGRLFRPLPPPSAFPQEI